MSKFKEYLEATKVDKETHENDLLLQYLKSKGIESDKDLKFVLKFLVDYVIISKSKLGTQKRNKLIDKINELYKMPKNLRTMLKNQLKVLKNQNEFIWKILK